MSVDSSMVATESPDGIPNWASVLFEAMAQRETAKPPVLMVRVGVAAQISGFSKRTFQKAVEDGLAPQAAFRSHRISMWCVSELKAWTEHGCPPRVSWEAQWKALRRKANG